MLKIYRNYGKSLLLLAWWEDFVARFFHLELQLQRIIGIWPEKNLTRYSMRSKFVKFVQTLLKDWFHWRSVLIFVVVCYWQPDASCTWKVHAVPNEIFQFFLVHLIINWISHENYIYYIYYIIFHQSYINMEYTNALVMDVNIIYLFVLYSNVPPSAIHLIKKLRVIHNVKSIIFLPFCQLCSAISSIMGKLYFFYKYLCET